MIRTVHTVLSRRLPDLICSLRISQVGFGEEANPSMNIGICLFAGGILAKKLDTLNDRLATMRKDFEEKNLEIETETKNFVS